MADQLLQQAQELFEGHIDFEGQKLSELISTALLAFSGILAFVLGFVQRDIYVTLWVGLGGTALTFLIVIPPWPIYNENPEKWLPSSSSISGAAIEVDRKKIN